MYIEVLEECGVRQSTDFTLSIISYQVGDLHHISVYSSRFGEKGYVSERFIALADLLTDVGLLAEQFGLDIEELKKDGFERFKHRIEEVMRAQTEKVYGDSGEGSR